MTFSDRLGIKSSTSGLGEQLRYFPANKIRKWLPAIFGMVFLIISMAVFFYGIFIATKEMQLHGAIVFGSNIVWPGSIAIILLIISIWFVWLAYTRWELIGIEYQNGFAFKDHKGLQTWSWQDITSIRTAITRQYTNGIYTGTSHVYRVTGKNGRQLVLNDSLSNVEQIASIIEEKTFPVLYAQAFKKFTDGNFLAFGVVKLNKSGLQVGKKDYKWEQIDSINLYNGVLQITKKGTGKLESSRIRVASLPNFRVLDSILRQMVGIQPGKDRSIPAKIK